MYYEAHTMWPINQYTLVTVWCKNGFILIYNLWSYSNLYIYIHLFIYILVSNFNSASFLFPHSYETLLYIASEIASAGAYLESTKQTHRDIASRNVIVYEKNLTIKLTDLAMFEEKYSADYYNGLPIRWMSPESVVRTEFTTQSDVYSFGVFLWEVLTYCKCRPFVEYSDEDLISAVYRYVDNGEQFVQLPRPTHCSTEIFELIQECCNCNDTQRPTFKEVYLFLQRKTLDFTKPMGGGTLSHL